MNIIYVASSWKNPFYNNIIKTLKLYNFNFYNFRNPIKNDNGFHWSEIDKNWFNWTFKEYINGLLDYRAINGFNKDFSAMKLCSCCILILPSGKSSHLELGYFVGAKKLTIIYMPVKQEPELMYKMVDLISNDFEKIIQFLKNKNY